MTIQEQKDLITALYKDIFQNAELDKFDKYFTKDFVEDNNYDVLDHDTMVSHVKSLGEHPEKVRFDLEFIVNVPGQVVVRTIVTYDDQIAGAPPLSLLLSFWGINAEGKIDRCIEVEHATPVDDDN